MAQNPIESSLQKEIVVKRIAWLLWVIFPLLSYAEGLDTLHHWKMEVSAMPGRLISTDRWQKEWMKEKNNMAYDVRVSFRTLPQDSDSFAADYGYPTLSVGLRWQQNHGITMHKPLSSSWPYLEEVDYDSQMGNIITLYGQFSRPLWQNERWQVGYDLNFGVGYSHRRYDVKDNIDNEVIGAHWNIFFGMGANASYRIGRNWGLSGGVQFYHHSNGALNRPNKGANILSPYLGAFFLWDKPSAEKTPLSSHPQTETRFQPSLYFQFDLSVGSRTMLEEWIHTQFETRPGEEDYRKATFRNYASYSFQTSMMYRYARRWASGIGADVYYGNYHKKAEVFNRYRGYNDKLSPWSVGLSIRHEVFYHRLSLPMSLGFYVYRNMGEMAKELEKPYYETIGLSYRIPGIEWKIGGRVKAHLAKADLTEFTISIPLTIHSSPF